VRLEDNYRCTAPILAAANRLVAHNRVRHAKTLRAHKSSTAEVRFLEFPDDQLEAEKVISEIKFLATKKDVPLSDFAILFRTNEQPRVFESELRRAQVPYLLMGSQSFFDRREIRDLLAYLKVLAYPSDEMSLLRIINTPARGISAATVEKVLNRAVTTGVSFWDAARTAAAEKMIPEKAAQAVDSFHGLLNAYRGRFHSAPHQLDVQLRSLIEQIDYESEILKLYKDPQQQLARTAMIDEFVETLSEYQRNDPDPSLRGFLGSIALDDRAEEPDDREQLSENAVKLMTLHSAKGLEFPRVYLVGMEEGLLPHKRSVDATDAEIAEERRLAYVGVTRAQDHLTLTRAQARRKWGKRRESMPSRFLFEMRADGESLPAHQDEAVSENDFPASAAIGNSAR